jgi:putative peptide zinc metalloprotease protein
VANLVYNLISSEFIQFTDTNIFSGEKKVIEHSFTNRLTNYLYKIMFIRFILKDVDSFLTKSYRLAINLLFTSMGKLGILIIIMTGLLLFLDQANKSISYIPLSNHLLLIIILIVVLNYLLTIFHELGHAYTVKSYNREVHRMGIIFYWLGLYAFVDCSDMWLSDSKSHIIVSLAGPITDLILAGIASICMLFVENSEIKLFLWMLALYLYFSVITNLNPMHDGDGSQIISNLFNKTKLRHTSFSLLNKLNIYSLIKSEFLKKYKYELLYLIICLSFFIIYIIIAVIAQYYLRLILPSTVLGISVLHLFWILPSIVTLNFILKTWRYQKYALLNS